MDNKLPVITSRPPLTGSLISATNAARITAKAAMSSGLTGQIGRNKRTASTRSRAVRTKLCVSTVSSSAVSAKARAGDVTPVSLRAAARAARKTAKSRTARPGARVGAPETVRPARRSAGAPRAAPRRRPYGPGSGSPKSGGDAVRGDLPDEPGRGQRPEESSREQNDTPRQYPVNVRPGGKLYLNTVDSTLPAANKAGQAVGGLAPGCG